MEIATRYKDARANLRKVESEIFVFLKDMFEERERVRTEGYPSLLTIPNLSFQPSPKLEKLSDFHSVGHFIHHYDFRTYKENVLIDIYTDYYLRFDITDKENHVHHVRIPKSWLEDKEYALSCLKIEVDEQIEVVKKQVQADYLEVLAEYKKLPTCNLEKIYTVLTEIKEMGIF